MRGAAQAFDRRHQVNVGRLKRTNYLLESDAGKHAPESVPLFAKRLYAVQSQRLIVPERPLDVAKTTKHGTVADLRELAAPATRPTLLPWLKVAAPRVSARAEAGYAGTTWRRYHAHASPSIGRPLAVHQPAVKAAFDLHCSIWAPRKVWCDAKDLYDTDAVELQRFKHDWKATLKLGVSKIIMRVDDDGIEDTDGDGVPDEVEEVGEVLWAHHDLYYLLFTMYTCLGSDIHYLSLNGFTELTDDFLLVEKDSEYCKRADMDRLFLAVDAASTNRERQEQWEEQRAVSAGEKPTSKGRFKATDRGKALSRVEFIVALVHVAIHKYVLPRIEVDVSAALERLLAVDILSRVEPKSLPDTNLFRHEVCYTQSVTEVLVSHEQALRLLFASIGGDSGRGQALIDLSEWLAFLKAVDMIGADASERDVKLCFAWSRMAVIDGKTMKGLLRESNLPFEGFLEALCRLSMLKALPTDAEIAQCGCQHAGEWVQQTRLEDPEYFDALVQARSLPWGHGPALQSAARCVDHLIALIITEIKKDLDVDSSSLGLSEPQAVSWANGHMKIRRQE